MYEATDALNSASSAACRINPDCGADGGRADLFEGV
jgi:hypothetical protein